MQKLCVITSNNNHERQIFSYLQRTLVGKLGTPQKKESKLHTRVSEWLFMSSLWPTLFIVVAYLALVNIFMPIYMKNRKPYKLKTTIKIYNLFQIAACTWLIYWVLTSGWIQGEYNMGCQPVDYSNNPTALFLLRGFHMTYFVKMSELIETIFFLLRKKYNQVTKLHVYHHASTLTLAWIGCKYIGGGMSSLPIMINSFIHIMMYTYYYLASLGPKWQKKIAPWKPRLTIAQMVQFTFLIMHSLTGLLPSCHVPKMFLLLYLPNVLLIYKMFYDFYKENYFKNNNYYKKVE